MGKTIDGGSKFLCNFSVYLPDHVILSQKAVMFSYIYGSKDLEVPMLLFQSVFSEWYCDKHELDTISHFVIGT